MDTASNEVRRDRILRMLRNLPDDERRTTIGEALRQMEEDSNKPSVVSRYDILVWAAQAVTGVQLTAKRTQEDTKVRMLVAHQLHNEGYTFHQVGKAMSRDHSTASYLYKKMDDVLKNPAIWREMSDNYKRFIELLQQYD